MERALVGRSLLVDGDDHGVAPRGLGVGQDLSTQLEVRARIELEPERSGGGLRDPLVGKAGCMAHDHGRVRGGGRFVHPEFAVGVERALAGRRREHDRATERAPEHLDRRIDGMHVDWGVAFQCHPVERIPVATHRELGVGAACSVVIDRLWDVGLEHRFEVPGGDHFGEPWHAAVSGECRRVLLGSEQR